MIYESSLKHHGILGMKWGVRRYQPYPSGHSGGKEIGEAARSRKEQRQIKKAQKKYDKAYRKNFVTAYNRAANYINTSPEARKFIDDFNKSWEKDFEGFLDWSKGPKYQEYLNAYNNWVSDLVDTSMKDLIGERPE